MTRMLEIEISEELLQSLNERAQQLKVSPSQLAAMSVREALHVPVARICVQSAPIA